MPNPQFLADVELLAKTQREQGKEKADELFRTLQSTRKMVRWEAIVLAEAVQKRVKQLL